MAAKRRHRRRLDEIEVPEQADPHDARADMQPSHQERPENEAVELGLSEIDQEDDEREAETGEHGIAKIRKESGHVSPRTIPE